MKPKIDQTEKEEKELSPYQDCFWSPCSGGRRKDPSKGSSFWKRFLGQKKLLVQLKQITNPLKKRSLFEVDRQQQASPAESFFLNSDIRISLAP